MVDCPLERENLIKYKKSGFMPICNDLFNNYFLFQNRVDHYQVFFLQLCGLDLISIF